jgi:quinol monooxygenase YgiN
VCSVGAQVIVNAIRFTVNSEKRIELLQTIGRLLEPSKQADGCRTFRFYIDAADENSSLLMSEWETQSDLINYLRSNDFAVLRGAITVLSIRGIDSKALIPALKFRP